MAWVVRDVAEKYIAENATPPETKPRKGSIAKSGARGLIG